MNSGNTKLKVFIQEDDLVCRQKIGDDLKKCDYNIYFFSKDESIFDLIRFNPDMIIQDYKTQKVIDLRQWELPV